MPAFSRSLRGPGRLAGRLSGCLAPCFLLAFLVFGMGLLGAGRALAHGVFLFAWAEADRVCTESYFSKKSKVRGGEVSMLDAAGTLLASGRSDEEGLVCFPAPGRAGDLRFVVRAGQGHQAEFVLPAARRIADAASGPPAGAAAPSPALARAPPPISVLTPEPAGRTVPAGGASPGLERAAGSPLRPGNGPGNGPGSGPDNGPGGVMEARLRTVVREELRRELAPLQRALAEDRQEGGPGVRDILGGLGWIAGLTGFGLWYAGRRRQSP